MQITDNKEQVLLGVQRLRSLASCNPPTSLGLALELSMVSSRINTVKGSAPPVQLELLPLRPSFQKAQPLPASGCFNLWGSMNGYGPQSLRGIDVNQMPSSSESEGDPEEPPTLHLSGLAGLKREHEKASETDHERTFNEVTSRASDEEEGGSARKKLRLSKEQSALLEESFKEHSTLNPKQKNALAKQLNLRPRQVEVWFQNRRARTKLKQTEVDYELLKRCCESLSEENRRLQKEVAELRALKVGAPCVISHDFYMPLPATTLTMCPSCERLAPNAMGAAASSSTTTAANSVPFPKPHHFPLSFPPQQQPSAAC